MLRLGTVASVNLASATCRVAIGDIETGDLPWLTGAAGDTHIWCPPSVGEQVLLLAPEGDSLAGIVMRGLPSDANPAPGDSRKVVVTFADGARLAYDPEAQKLDVFLPDGGEAEIHAKVKILGDVDIQGALKVTETVTLDADLTAQGEVTAKGKQLSAHKHLGVTAGSAVSGAPQ